MTEACTVCREDGLEELCERCMQGQDAGSHQMLRGDRCAPLQNSSQRLYRKHCSWSQSLCLAALYRHSRVKLVAMKNKEPMTRMCNWKKSTMAECPLLLQKYILFRINTGVGYNLRNQTEHFSPNHQNTCNKC